MFGGEGGFFGGFGGGRIEPLRMRAVVNLKDLYTGKEYKVGLNRILSAPRYTLTS